MSVTDIRRAWWDTFTIVGCQMLTLPLSIAVVGLSTRLLGPDRFGRFSLLLSMAQLVVYLGLNWTAGGMVRFGKERLVQGRSIGAIFWARVALNAFCLAVAAVVLWGIGPAAAQFAGVPPALIGWMGLFLLAYFLYDLWSAALRTTGHMKAYALTTLLRYGVVLILCATVGLGWRRWDVAWAFAAEIVSFALVFLFSAAVLGRQRIFPIATGWQEFRLLIGYSWTVILAMVCGYLSDWMDLFFIKHFLSYEAVGIYQAAYRMMLFLSTLLMSFSTVLFPILVSLRTQGRQGWLDHYLDRWLVQAAFFWSIAIGLMGLSAPVWLPVVFGERFTGSVTPFVLLGVGLAFNILPGVCTVLFATYDRILYATVFAGIMAVINFFGNWWLIPRLGIAGAALATSASYLIGAVCYVWGSYRIMSRPLSWRSVLYPVMTGGVLLVSLGLPCVWKFLAAVLWLLGMVGAAKKQRAFSPADLSRWEGVQIPAPLRRGLEKVYRWLSAEPA